MKQPKECIYPECELSPAARGLCKIHYNSVNQLVLSGEYSWNELVKRGKVLESARGKNSVKSQIKAWLND